MILEREKRGEREREREREREKGREKHRLVASRDPTGHLLVSGDDAPTTRAPCPGPFVLSNREFWMPRFCPQYVLLSHQRLHHATFLIKVLRGHPSCCPSILHGLMLVGFASFSLTQDFYTMTRFISFFKWSSKAYGLECRRVKTTKHALGMVK